MLFILGNDSFRLVLYRALVEHCHIFAVDVSKYITKETFTILIVEFVIMPRLLLSSILVSFLCLFSRWDFLRQPY